MFQNKPVHIKYTAYTAKTGITTQSVPSLPNRSNSNHKTFFHAVPELSAKAFKFAKERGWHNNDLPRNLSLALIAEQGELFELFQWKQDIQDAPLTQNDISKAATELADITIYLMRLARACKVHFMPIPTPPTSTTKKARSI